MSKEAQYSVTVEENMNKFIGYSACVQSFQEVEDLYMKMRLNHAEARHIVCVWSLPGIKKHEVMDVCDDEEYGVASPLLQMFKENNITHRAVFIVRKVGNKLTAQRIQLY